LRQCTAATADYVRATHLAGATFATAISKV
jgi:hypothetical protein